MNLYLEELKSKKLTVFSLGIIIILGLAVRFYYFPSDIPIGTDGFFSFIYAAKTVFEGSLPIGYTTTNTGWSYFLSSFFIFSDTTEPLHLMHIQRTLSIVLSTITIIPAFFIFRNFVSVRWSLFGSFLLVVEPRLLLISLEGINFSLFFFLFVLIIALFLNKKNISFYFGFACIALATLVRYEGLLLIIPAVFMYLLKSNDKKSILNLLCMIFVLTIILVPIVTMQMEATKNICYNYDSDTICGEVGIIQNIISGPLFFYIYGILETPLSDPESPAFDKLEGLDRTSGKFMFDSIALMTISSLGKFLGLSIIPYFVFFIIFSLVLRIRTRKFLKFDWDKKMILLITSIMLLPAIYAYVREIDEVRYVLIIIPLVCILSISWTKSISEKISKNWSVIIVLIVLVLISSIIFIEFDKRDLIHDRESLLISQEIIGLTDKTNTFNQDGYVKTAVLIRDWPNLPETNEIGKIKHEFDKFPIGKYDSIKKFILDFRESGLEYLVVDKDNKIFDELREDPKKYSYLIKRFDSNDLNFKNHFLIYEIDYNLFTNSNK